MRDRLIVYVDGFNLYHGLHDKWRHTYLWLDLVALAHRVRPRSDLIGVQYFTAPVLNEPEAASRQSDYCAALKAHGQGLVSVIDGRYQSKTVRCRACGSTYVRYEEKETDVNIAVSLVADAAERRMDTALLISADSDLSPAVRAARRVFPALTVVAAFPPKRYSSELKAVMPRSFHLGHSHIRQSLLPETVRGEGTLRWSRPLKWGGPRRQP